MIITTSIFPQDEASREVIAKHEQFCCDYSLLCKTRGDVFAHTYRHGQPVTTRGAQYGDVVAYFRETCPNTLLFWLKFGSRRDGMFDIDWLVPDADAAILLAMKFG